METQKTRTLTGNPTQAVARLSNQNRPLLGTMLALVAIAGFLTQPTAAAAQTTGPAESVLSAEIAPEVDLEWVPADSADTDAAKGGVWALVITAGGIVIRHCAPNIDRCAGYVRIGFSTAVAAKKFACRKYGRYC